MSLGRLFICIMHRISSALGIRKEKRDPDFEECLQDEINRAELLGWACCMLENEAWNFLYEKYGDRIYRLRYEGIWKNSKNRKS